MLVARRQPGLPNHFSATQQIALTPVAALASCKCRNHSYESR